MFISLLDTLPLIIHLEITHVEIIHLGIIHLEIIHLEIIQPDPEIIQPEIIQPEIIHPECRIFHISQIRLLSNVSNACDLQVLEVGSRFLLSLNKWGLSGLSGCYIGRALQGHLCGVS